MAATVRKYNPGFLSVDDLVATFCVRTAECESLIEALHECSGNANTHQIVIGPRGSGKTSLLLRVAAEVERDADLSARFFPILFAEESYHVSTTGEFWLECLSRLADQAPAGDGDVDLHRTVEEFHAIDGDRTLENRCLGVLQDFASREDKRLVLIVENLNMMFRDMGDDDAGWRLRKVLQTEPRIVLLASATGKFDQITDPRHALYQSLRVMHLQPLGRKDSATLWQTVAGQNPAPAAVQALRILTGGNPRMLAVMARASTKLPFPRLMTALLDLVDDHTEYFKSQLDALPAQERRVYLALANLWKPASAREIAERARLGTSQCSAQLARLVDRGAVEVSGGSARRKLYCLTERLHNIYYLMRRARGPAPGLEALARFMEAYYFIDTPSEGPARTGPSGIPDSRLRGHLVRARTHLEEGDDEACARDVETALSILPGLDTLPRDALLTLVRLTPGVGTERMRELIRSSPAGDLLLPLTAALAQELGLDSRVAREVEEVAEDIRRDLFARPGNRAGRAAA